MEAPYQFYRYALEFLDSANQQVARLPLEANWEPAVECALFAAQQAGLDQGLQGEMTWDVVPDPDPVVGLPYCQGFRVNLEVAGHRAGDQFPLTYFSATARALASNLVAQGRLQAGETFQYKLLAWPHSAMPGQRTVSDNIEQQLLPLPIRVLPERFKADSTDVLSGPSQPGDIPVDISRQVLEEADALTLEAGATECGGLLIGHLGRREEEGELRVVVTAQIPAEQTESQLASLVFTPATWAAARREIRQKGCQAVTIGWWHSHPARHWCSPECPPAKRAVCPLMADFFSAQDRQFHQAMYPKAYTIALVVTHTHEGLRHAVYGWRKAQLEERAFHIINRKP